MAFPKRPNALADTASDDPQSLGASLSQTFPWEGHPLPATLVGTHNLPKVTGAHQVPP